MTDLKQQADELKQTGNTALQQGKIDEAIQIYSEAIKCDPENAALFSNRSAAYCKGKKYKEALTDAETAIQLNPEWAKGYSRKGAALAFMNRHEEALMAYEEGLEHDKDNEQIQVAIKECKAQLTGPAGSQPLMNPFSDPQVFEKLEKDSRTKEFLKDPSFKAIIEKLQKNPKELGQYIQDSRIMTALGALLGVQMDVTDDVHMKDAMDKAKENGPASDNEAKHEATKENANSNESSGKTSGDEPMDTEEGDKKKAIAEKEKGNEAYKKRDFETAVQHYDKAIELDPKNITFRTNKAAVYFEQKKLDECIQECERAVDIGRENRTDYKLIAKIDWSIEDILHSLW